MCDFYPSYEELLPPEWQRIMPYELVGAIEHRYGEGMEGYRTNAFMPDGRWVNAGIFRNSVTEAIHEVVDAIFNLMMCRLKGNIPEQEVTAIIQGLTTCYVTLRAWEAKGELTCQMMPTQGAQT